MDVEADEGPATTSRGRRTLFDSMSTSQVTDRMLSRALHVRHRLSSARIRNSSLWSVGVVLSVLRVKDDSEGQRRRGRGRQ
jgi:hypothetical protein